MDDDLTRLTEKTIDTVIRSFKPWEDGSYLRWDAELERVEALLGEAYVLHDSASLLASIRAQRVLLAFETDQFERILELSSIALCESRADHPDFVTVVLFRAHALHMLGRHVEEVQEVLAAARACSTGQHLEYISLLQHLAKNHRGSIPQDRQFLHKLRAAIEALRADLYQSLPDVKSESEIEETVLRVTDEMRRVNRELTEAILRDNSCRP